MRLALTPSPASLGAESFLLPCFWHLYPRKTDGFAFPWMHTQSHPQTLKLIHTLCMHLHTFAEQHTTKGTNNLQIADMVTLTNKQTPVGIHSDTQHLGEGQLHKYARPSFLGSEWRSNHNNKYFPCCCPLHFLSLVHRKRALAVAGKVQHLQVTARNNTW